MIIPQTRGRRSKYDFSTILEEKISTYDFSKSLRVCVINYAKKNGVKIETRNINNKLYVYNKSLA